MEKSASHLKHTRGSDSLPALLRQKAADRVESHKAQGRQAFLTHFGQMLTE